MIYEINPRIDQLSPMSEATEHVAGIADAVESIASDLMSEASDSAFSTPISTLSARSWETFSVSTASIGDGRTQIINELSEWAFAGASEQENRHRIDAAGQILSVFQRKSPVLSINDSCITDLPKCIGMLTHLQTLDLSGCTSLRSLPDVLDHFQSLRRLDVRGCISLTALPRSAAAMRYFTHLFPKGSGVALSDPLGSKNKRVQA